MSGRSLFPGFLFLDGCFERNIWCRFVLISMLHVDATSGSSWRKWKRVYGSGKPNQIAQVVSEWWCFFFFLSVSLRIIASSFLEPCPYPDLNKCIREREIKKKGSINTFSFKSHQDWIRSKKKLYELVGNSIQRFRQTVDENLTRKLTGFVRNWLVLFGMMTCPPSGANFASNLNRQLWINDSRKWSWWNHWNWAIDSISNVRKQQEMRWIISKISSERNKRKTEEKASFPINQ